MQQTQRPRLIPLCNHGCGRIMLTGERRCTACTLFAVMKRCSHSTVLRLARRRLLKERLVGSGSIKRDPVSGNWYDCRGSQPNRAHTWECPTCHSQWMASKRIHAETNGVCGPCRQQAAIDRKARTDGSKRRTTSGYIEIKHQGKWLLEHRLVMQNAIGRPLLKTETVHHINGDRADNNLDNLQLRTGHHGSGQAWCCLDCGSSNIAATPIGGEHDDRRLSGAAR